jgi:hypothetical protein
MLDEESERYFRAPERALDTRYDDRERNTRLLEVAYWTGLGDTPTQIAEYLHCDANTVRRDMRLLGEVLDRPSAWRKPPPD